MNGQMNFDPMTGQPLNNNQAQPVTQPEVNTQPVAQTEVATQPVAQTEVNTQSTEQPVENSVPTETTAPVNNAAAIQQQMQTIATVDQNTQNFIDNTQSTTEVKVDENKDKKNLIIVISLFAIIILAIIFLFPYLFKIIG